jgi:hypothetical protein
MVGGNNRGNSPDFGTPDGMASQAAACFQKELQSHFADAFHMPAVGSYTRS